jgi:hypothetical protein
LLIFRVLRTERLAFGEMPPGGVETTTDYA